VTQVVLNPSPTASGAIGRNETLSVAGEQGDVRVYAGAIAFSVGAPDNGLDRLLVEEPIDYAAGVAALRRGKPIEEIDFPVGGPFGA